MDHAQQLSVRVAELVCGVETLAGLREYPGNENRLEEAVSLGPHGRENPRKRLSFDVLHCEKELSLGLPERKRMHYVRVHKQGCDPGLAQKHLHVPRVAWPLGEQTLERNDTLE